jgi:hypothetical protein
MALTNALIVVACIAAGVALAMKGHDNAVCWTSAVAIAAVIEGTL